MKSVVIPLYLKGDYEVHREKCMPQAYFVHSRNSDVSNVSHFAAYHAHSYVSCQCGDSLHIFAYL